jgi:hypothetical protein
MMMWRRWGMGERDNGEGGLKESRPCVFIYSRPRSRSGGQFSSQSGILTVASHIKQMIPSFKSFPPTQPPQPDSEVSAPSSKHKSSKKDRKRSRERTRNVDESEKPARKHKHKQERRDRDYDFKRDDHRQASSSSTTFFSDYRGNRTAAHGGGTDSIRIPKYNLVARRSFQNLVKYN